MQISKVNFLFNNIIIIIIIYYKINYQNFFFAICYR